VGVAFLQSGIGGRVEQGIHAGEDGKAAGRRGLLGQTFNRPWGAWCQRHLLPIKSQAVIA
jgi:hypothetical protein